METQYSASCTESRLFRAHRTFYVIFFRFNDVGYRINTRKLLHALEIDREISVLRPSLKQLMKINSRGQI